MRLASIKLTFGLLLAVVAGCDRAPGDDAAPRPTEENTAVAAAAVKAAAPPRAAPAAKIEETGAAAAHADTAECNPKLAAPPVSDEIQEVSVGTAPPRGPADAKVTIVMFSDFECPFCLRALSTLRVIEQRYPGKVRFAFRNYPIPSHKNARLAAKAALAANDQGKFWEYHDALFAHQDELSRGALERYAGELGLDVERFKRELDDSVLDVAIDADTEDANRLKVHGTPSFFVNGRQIMGAQAIEVFQDVIDKALADASR